MLNHINHKMPIYKDCTLAEVLLIAFSSLVFLIITLSLLSKIFIGYVWPGYLLSSVLFIFVTKFGLSKLQKLKYGKPYGYYQQLIIKHLSESGFIQSKYLTRIGRWSVRRKTCK